MNKHEDSLASGYKGQLQSKPRIFWKFQKFLRGYFSAYDTVMAESQQILKNIVYTSRSPQELTD